MILTHAVMQKEIKKHRNKEKAEIYQHFFKTGKGEYGEGDTFYGIVVPVCRKLAKQFADASLGEVRKLLQSPIHEERLIALFIMMLQYEKGNTKEREKIFKTYLAQKKYINNWDLIDLSAPKIVGRHVYESDRKVLYTLAHSKQWNERRIAMLACFYFIAQQDFTDAFAIAEILIHDQHDLLQKAVGWMLREIGKRSLDTEETFLKQYAPTMPRTALRYAIEKFPEQKRRRYLNMKKK